MFSSNEDSISHGYWPSVADLFLTLFVIAITLVVVIFYISLPQEIPEGEILISSSNNTHLTEIQDSLNDLQKNLNKPSISKNTETPSLILNYANLKDTLNKCKNSLATKEPKETQLEKIKSLEEELTLSRNQQANLEKKIDSLELELIYSKKQHSDPEKKIATLEQELMLSENQHANLEKKINIHIAENANLKNMLHDKPPIIQLNEADDPTYRFTSGSYEISYLFKQKLHRDIFLKLKREILTRHTKNQVKVDTLEIIGHTDGVPLNRKIGNLDQKLPAALEKNLTVLEGLIPGSNNDLGLLRALAIRKEWEEFLGNYEILDHDRELLKNIEIRCYSAGQTIPPLENASTVKEDNPAARRIEIRLTGLKNDARKP